MSRFLDQENIDALVASLMEDRTSKTDGDAPPSAPLPGSEHVNVKHVERAIEELRKDPARREIFDGAMGEHDSDSEADASMFFNLAYFCGRDVSLMEAAALRSGRVRPKWNQRRNNTTWLQQELARAAELVQGVWEPPRNFNTGGTAHKGGGNDSNDGVFEDLAHLPDPEDFPLSALPPTTREFVREGAASIGCPIDYIGVAVLTALSTAIGDTRRIFLKKDWSEGAAVYAAIVGVPASKKSPAMNVALKAVRERQVVLKREYDRRKEEYESELRDYKKAPKDGPTKLSRPKKPTLERTYVDDTTVERLADVLNENPRGVLVAKDELSGWLGAMNQYKQGKGADRQFWLSAHTNQPSVVDRKANEEPVMVLRPWVSITGGIQPEVLPAFGKDQGDGLIDRFVFAYPAPRVSRWSDDEISDDARDGYAATIKSLYGLRHAEDGKGDLFPSRVGMTDGAKKLFVEEYDRLHEELADPGFPQRLCSVWGKLEAYLARLALILAMARVAEFAAEGQQVREEVTREDMVRAIKLLKYFKNHARRVYAGLYGVSSSDRLAADLRDFLVYRGGNWEGTASELHEALDSEHKPQRPEDLAKVVRTIAKRSSLLQLKDLQRTSNRRPFRLALETAGIAGTAVMPSSQDGSEDE